jgi:simple sugar transport system permease protein
VDGGLLTVSVIVGFVASSIRLATPLLLTSLGETFCQRAGVMNIGIEGLMTLGSLAGFLVGYFTGSPWLGVASGLVVGAVFSCVHGYLSAVLATNQIVSGLALNLLALGLVIFGYRAILGIPTVEPRAVTFGPVVIPLLSSIPVIGPALFQHHIWVYLALLLVPLCHFVLFRTDWGLQITAVGEDPLTAESAGVSVWWVRFATVVVGGALAGLGGAVLSLGDLGIFKEIMVAGRGFIAIAIVMFGRFTPIGVLGAAFFFGAANALQLRFQTFFVSQGFISSNFVLGLPYLLTIAALLISSKRQAIPSALCVPYEGGEHRG